MASELRLPALALPGLSPDSLGNYLASLGLLRVLSRKWPSTRIGWRDEVLRVIGGPTSLDELLDELVRIASTQVSSDVSKREWNQYDTAWSEDQKKGTKAKSGRRSRSGWRKRPKHNFDLFAAHAVPHARVTSTHSLAAAAMLGVETSRRVGSRPVDALAVTAEAGKGGEGTRKERCARDRSQRAVDERRSALQASSSVGSPPRGWSRSSAPAPGSARPRSSTTAASRPPARDRSPPGRWCLLVKAWRSSLAVPPDDSVLVWTRRRCLPLRHPAHRRELGEGGGPAPWRTLDSDLEPTDVARRGKLAVLAWAR